MIFSSIFFLEMVSRKIYLTNFFLTSFLIFQSQLRWVAQFLPWNHGGVKKIDSRWDLSIKGSWFEPCFRSRTNWLKVWYWWCSADPDGPDGLDGQRALIGRKSSVLRVDALNSRKIQISGFLLTVPIYLIQHHNKKNSERFGVQKIFRNNFSKLTFSTQTLKTAKTLLIQTLKTVKLFLEFGASTLRTDDLKAVQGSTSTWKTVQIKF